MNARQRLERIENDNLAPYAIRSSESLGRTLHGNEDDPYRTRFQRDRDRILYSRYFKDLQYKTQVFLVTEGDFYRTRLTHTLEVVQHARTLARVLKLNEDLCEAIAYGHDLGHTPFGHIGEETLNEVLKDDGGFEHNFQSLKIVDELEKRYEKYAGLNLCYETREGIARHTTTYDNPKVPEEFRKYPMPSLEAQVVNIADPLAYCAHDLEDALNAGYLDYEDDIEAEGHNNPLLNKVIEKSKASFDNFERVEKVTKARMLVRSLIDVTNIMVMEETKKNIERFRIQSVEDVRKTNIGIVAAPVQEWEYFKRFKQFLFDRVYRSPQVCIMNEKGKLILLKMYDHIERRPEMLPKAHLSRFKKAANKTEQRRIIADYISGMTDRYAMDLYQMMFEPYEKVMFEFRE